MGNGGVVVASDCLLSSSRSSALALVVVVGGCCSVGRVCCVVKKSSALSRESRSLFFRWDRSTTPRNSECDSGDAVAAGEPADGRTEREERNLRTESKARTSMSVRTLVVLAVPHDRCRLRLNRRGLLTFECP